MFDQPGSCGESPVLPHMNILSLEQVDRCTALVPRDQQYSESFRAVLHTASPGLK